MLETGSRGQGTGNSASGMSVEAPFLLCHEGIGRVSPQMDHPCQVSYSIVGVDEPQFEAPRVCGRWAKQPIESIAAMTGVDQRKDEHGYRNDRRGWCGYMGGGIAGSRHRRPSGRAGGCRRELTRRNLARVGGQGLGGARSLPAGQSAALVEANISAAESIEEAVADVDYIQGVVPRSQIKAAVLKRIEAAARSGRDHRHQHLNRRLVGWPSPWRRLIASSACTSQPVAVHSGRGGHRPCRNRHVPGPRHRGAGRRPAS